MKSSFQITFINVKGKRLKKTSTGSTSQKKGTGIHDELAKYINSGAREGTAGKMLKEMEGEFKCEFLQAEVIISGYAVSRTSSKVDFHNGVIDAVAMKPRSSPKDDPRIFIVDWKTTSKTDLVDLSNWWSDVSNFKTPLYQCLLYRELLQMHLELNKIKAQVDIMLVPFHQSNPEVLMPGLCSDFTQMDKIGLLDGLKKYKWVRDESSCVQTITLPCNLFKGNLYRHIDTKTKILKDETKVIDTFDDQVTIGMLRKQFGLLRIKVEDNVENKDEKDSGLKDSVRSKAKAQKDKTDEAEDQEEKKGITDIIRNKLWYAISLVFLLTMV